MAGKSQLKDMTGQTFGLLTVIARQGQYKNTTRAAWLVRCRCGQERIASGDNLRLGRQISCGLSGCRKVPEPTHGKSRTRIYIVWSAMISRCENPNQSSYPNYGGRGIAVCERWRHSFENFLADMGEPEKGMSIDRINVNGNYEPGNCRWATSQEQANNTRRNRVISTPDGTFSIAEAAKIAGISYNAMQNRLKLGMTGEQAMQPNQRPWLSTIS